MHNAVPSLPGVGWLPTQVNVIFFFLSIFLLLLLAFNAQAKACLMLWQKPCLSVTSYVQS